ncbi:NAD(P)H-binding protein [Micromonospora sp. WMMC264]|uniref:NAD(P)-dependent oxidoreductase n=1 Tax=unclassified Micromonospora TaxID=2617518 RepID=UPI000DE8F7C0|nr:MULTISPECIES: NAD(P)H-binding protein [unclassified Micromonospora]RBQ06560.1 flavin reductase [Micromonospora sp. LHW51205]WBB87908.1 NAD(P)H-binding protein [Micromonospora sp. WMMC264]
MTSIAVFGAGGRAGRAVTAEAHRRGHRVTAVVRDPARHPDLTSAVRGDVTDPETVTSIGYGHDAVVHAVSPASGPDALAAAGLDPEFFVRAADALLHGLARADVPRLVAIGLFATLIDAHGRPLYDDPAVLPAELRPFALSHAAGLDRLRAADTTVDWLVLTPPAALDVAGTRTGRYRLGGERAPASAPLSYADLAVAVVDEIESPRHHRTRVSVTGDGPA